MIVICGKDLNDIYEQLEIIENEVDNGATCGVGVSDEELLTLLTALM